MNNASQASKLSRAPSVPALFWGFLEVAASSFGGAGAWARRVLVDKRGWLSDAEFTEALGLSQVLPGPNVVNLAIQLGDRFRGPPGALAAFSGMMVVPSGAVIALDLLLMRWIHVPALRAALGGLAAGAAGMVWAMGLKMGARFRRLPVPALIAALVFAAAGPLRLPLLGVVLAAVPPSLLWSWRHE